jgi:hypothetical protein
VLYFFVGFYTRSGVYRRGDYSSGFLTENRLNVTSNAH